MRLFIKNSILIFLIFTFIGLAFGQDILLNGAFENWTDNLPDDWTQAENVSIQRSRGGIVRSGNAVKQVGDGGTKALGQLIGDISPGTTYTLTIWYTFTTGDETHASIWCYWKDGETNLNNNADELRGPNGGYLDYIYYYGTGYQHLWNTYTTEVTAPASANSFYFEVQTHIAAEVCYDDFSFVITEAPTPITLASFTAIANNGTANKWITPRASHNS